MIGSLEVVRERTLVVSFRLNSFVGGACFVLFFFNYTSSSLCPIPDDLLHFAGGRDYHDDYGYLPQRVEQSQQRCALQTKTNKVYACVLFHFQFRSPFSRSCTSCAYWLLSLRVNSNYSSLCFSLHFIRCSHFSLFFLFFFLPLFDACVHL